MTDYDRIQQADLSELALKKIKVCKGWRSKMLELGGACDDDDAAIIFSDVAGRFDDQARELTTLLEDYQ